MSDYMAQKADDQIEMGLKQKEQFEAWLRTVCFQKPTREGYDLAKKAWCAGINWSDEQERL